MSARVKKRITYDAATQDLWRVAESGDVDEFARILPRVQDINAQNQHGMTALMRAAYHGNELMVRALLEHGADPNSTRNDRFTALALAAFFGHTEIVKTLIEHGAKTEILTRCGTSAVMWASARTFEEAARCLQSRSRVRKAARASAPALALVPAPAPAEPARVPAPVGPIVVKTLKDPPEIWDLVHEAPRDFNPGSAFFSRLSSMKTSLTVWVAAVLLVSATGIVGLVLLRGSQASGLQPEQPVTQVATESEVTAPENVQAREVPVSAPAVEVAPTEPVVSHHASELPDATSKPNSPKKVLLTRQSRIRSNANEGIVETAEISEPPAPPATVATPKFETRTPAKPNESVSPQLITPAKTAPKAKVIQWP